MRHVIVFWIVIIRVIITYPKTGLYSEEAMLSASVYYRGCCTVNLWKVSGEWCVVVPLDATMKCIFTAVLPDNNILIVDPCVTCGFHSPFSYIFFNCSHIRCLTMTSAANHLHCISIPFVQRKFLLNYFFTRTLWNLILSGWFPNHYNLNVFKYNVILPVYPHIHYLFSLPHIQ